MAVSTAIRRSRAATNRARQGTPVAEMRALVVVDQERLRAMAWARFHTVRKRLEKASRDLHRHEEVDIGAYASWLHCTFPILVTTLRELHEQLTAKARKIAQVQAMSFDSGRSVKRLWREQKERAQNPRAVPNADDFDDSDDESPRRDGDEELFQREPTPARSHSAREIYRRLVQRLHPDCGGVWTPERERLWHEVQQAWAQGDADWLARLEVDWESAHEVLGPSSPLSRLYRAIEELDAARRDTERKLRDYRRSPAWRFTLGEAKRAALQEKIETTLLAEIALLRRQLRPLDAMIEAWEEDWTRADHRGKHHRRSRTRY